MRSRKRAKVKNAVIKMGEMMNKYCDLVWYARNNRPTHLENENYEALGALQKIKLKYPKEVKSLAEDDNWSHGFNSGMLAASRLYHEMIEGDVEFALNNHPDLDS